MNKMVWKSCSWRMRLSYVMCTKSENVFTFCDKWYSAAWEKFLGNRQELLWLGSLSILENIADNYSSWIQFRRILRQVESKARDKSCYVLACFGYKRVLFRLKRILI